MLYQIVDTSKTKEISIKGIIISKLLNNPPASCCLINFDFLQLHTLHFDKMIILLLFVFPSF